MQKIADWRWSFFTIDLELTNNCGQNCSFCPRTSLTRPKGFMEKELAKKLIDELAANNSRITFCGMGNPLLHPDFLEIADYCRSIDGLSFGVTIQAPALIEKNRKILIEARPGFVEISFPTIDKALFSCIFPGENLDTCLENVMALVEERKSNRGMGIVALETSQDKYSPEDQVKFWTDKDIACRVTHCHSRGGNLKNNELVLAKPFHRKFCGLFATHAFITWEGKLLACCHDLTGETTISDLSKESLLQAGEKKVQMINSEMPFKICQNCDEPAAAREIPERPYPESSGARRRFMKNWAKL